MAKEDEEEEKADKEDEKKAGGKKEEKKIDKKAMGKATRETVKATYCEAFSSFFKSP